METRSVDAEPRQVLEPTEYFQVGRQADGMRIYLRYDLFRALDDFAVRDTSREQAGLLVGRVHHDETDGGFLVVEDAIDSSVGDERTGRFGASTWQHARRIAKSRHPGKAIVGWFHTHPGTGLELSEEEAEVHRKFFPEPWQVVYVVDPVQRDRNFHFKRGSALLAAAGFRIFGKETPPTAAQPAPEIRSVKPDEHLKERYLERSLEKIQKMLRNPGMTTRDWIIIGLLALNLAVMLFRPMPPVTVDNSEVTAGQAQMSEQISAMKNRLERLEAHLAALQMIDEELSLAPSPTPESAEVESAPETPVSKPSAAAASSPTGKMVKLHKVAAGDTLSTITEKYYSSSSPALVTALARFNKLKAPNFDIYPGDTVKIPAREALPQ